MERLDTQKTEGEVVKLLEDDDQIVQGSKMMKLCLGVAFCFRHTFQPSLFLETSLLVVCLEESTVCPPALPEL